MKSELRFGVTFLTPEPNKRLKRVDGNDLYNIVALAKSDSPDNYEEVDEFWIPDYIPPVEEEPEEDLVIEPDYEGKISYEDAQKLLSTIDTMKGRIVSLQENNDMLVECILEMSEVIYNV